MDHNFEERVLASLDRWTSAFNEGRSEFFEEFAEDAMIFTADSSEPLKGREAYRQNYQSAFTAEKHEKTILDRSVQIIGDKAVVTQVARIRQQDTSADVRQTMVYGNTSEGVKVLHLHTALVPQGETSEPMTSPSVRVVNERIATVADVLGVAQ